jgi:hypothetical protein
MNEILQKLIEEATTFLFKQRGLDKESCRQAMYYILTNQWISVDEALPEYEEDVFVRFIEHFQNNTDEFEVGYCTRWRTSDKSVKTDSKEFSIIGNMEITHWMPIPELKGGEE